MRICAFLPRRLLGSGCLLLLGGCIGGPSNDGPTDGVVPGDDTGTVPTGPTGFIAIALPANDVNATVMVGETPIDPDTETGEGTYTVVHPVGECDVWVQSSTFTYLEQFPIVSESKTEHVAWTEYGDYGVVVGTSSEPTIYVEDGESTEVYVGLVNHPTYGEIIAIRGLKLDGIPMLGYDFRGESPGSATEVFQGSVSGDRALITLKRWLVGDDGEPWTSDDEFDNSWDYEKR